LSDPLASGIVVRLNQPGGNIAGFATFEASLGGKWLELLSEIAPGSSGPQSCSIAISSRLHLPPHRFIYFTGSHRISIHFSYIIPCRLNRLRSLHSSF
jgi:hypothetical protein